MLNALVMRALLMAPVMVVVSVVVFGLIHLVPGNPIDNLVKPGMPAEQREALVRHYQLDAPLPVQYVTWMKGVLSGDLGVSIVGDRPVGDLLMYNLKPSVSLGIASLVISFGLGVTLGMLSACLKNTVWDHLAMTVATIGVTAPSFWTGLLLMYVFSVTLGWLPISGAGTFAALILPALTLGWAGAGLVARVTRASILEVMPKDFVTLLHARGIRSRAILFRHVLRNALAPVITIFGLRLGWILGGAVTVEIVFGRPGLGSLLVTALFRRDYPVVQGAMLALAMAIIIGTFVADLLCMLADPRLREKKA